MGRIIQVENTILQELFKTLEEMWLSFPLTGLFEAGIGKSKEDKGNFGGDCVQHSQMNALWCALEERANVVGLRVSPEALFIPEDAEKNPDKPPIKGQIIVPPGDLPKQDQIPGFQQQEDGELDVYWFEPPEPDPPPAGPDNDNVGPTNLADDINVSQINLLWNAIAQVCVRYCSPVQKRPWLSLGELLAELDIGEKSILTIIDPETNEEVPQNEFSIIPDRPDIILYKRFKEGTTSLEDVLFNDEPDADGKGGFGSKQFGLLIPSGTPTFVEHVNEAYQVILALEYIPMDIREIFMPVSAGSTFREVRIRVPIGCLTPVEQETIKAGDWINFITSAFNKAGIPVSGLGGGATALGGDVEQQAMSLCTFPFDESKWIVNNLARASFADIKALFEQIDVNDKDRPGKQPFPLEYDKVIFRFDLQNSQSGGGFDETNVAPIISKYILSIGTELGTEFPSNTLSFNLFRQGSLLFQLESFGAPNAGFQTKRITENDFEWDTDTIPQPNGSERFILNAFVDNQNSWTASPPQLVTPLSTVNTPDISGPNKFAKSSWTNRPTVFHVCGRIGNFKFQKGKIVEP